MTAPEVGVVMLAFGDEPVLDQAVDAVLASRGVRVELVLVDNGCTRDDVDEIADRPGVRLVRPGRNLGFTGGVNLGARHVDAPFLALVNSDAVVEPEALARLCAVAERPEVGIASGSIRLASDPGTMNSAGNPVHVLGLCWAGGLGEPAERYAREVEVPSASGAGLVMRTEVWRSLGGFPEELFAYQEDLELSWRCHQRGFQVRYVPGAVVVHHYEFSRNPRKMYLLERNRLLFVLTCYGTRTLAVLAPVLLAFEVAMLAVAALQGWAPQKVAGWRWVATHTRWVRHRRRAVQAARTVQDRALVTWWTARFDPAALPLPPGVGVLQAAMRLYWAVARRVL